MSGDPDNYNSAIEANANAMMEKGKAVFRYETFGDEAFWTDKMQLHKVLVDEKHGGIGDGLTPKEALDLGLKVDLQMLPSFLKRKIQEGKFLNDPWVTKELLKINAVVGVIAKFEDSRIVSVGITCASCHSTVSRASGIGSRLDGWANRDLNVGAIMALSPGLAEYAKMLDMDIATVKKILAAWGPGKFDAELNLDGKGFRPDGKSGATLIPEAFGHAGHNLHTWTGGWGNVTYWNAYVANLQLAGQGNFYDPRLMNAAQYPVAAKNGFGNKRSSVDMVTDKLAALQFYQLAMPAPKPPKSDYNEQAAVRGEIVFKGKAKCATCHVPPLFAEPGWSAHTPDEICIDDFQSSRSPDKTYVTQGLKGLWTHMKGGFYHDGRFATLMDVVEHYNSCKQLSLNQQEKTDLVEYLKSL
jgi:cytochrome c2